MSSLRLPLLLRVGLLAIMLVVVLSVISKTQSQPLFHTRTYCISPSFTPVQAALIEEGFHLWEYRSPIPRFHLNCADPFAVQVRPATSEDIQYWSNTFDSNGFWTCGVYDPDTNSVIILMDRIDSSKMLLVIAAHEAGHVLGAQDREPVNLSIMSAVVRQEVIDDFHLYPDDIEQLCKEQPCQ
jgi:uncharacterized membrane protein